MSFASAIGISQPPVGVGIGGTQSSSQTTSTPPTPQPLQPPPLHPPAAAAAAAAAPVSRVPTAIQGIYRLERTEQERERNLQSRYHVNTSNIIF